MQRSVILSALLLTAGPALSETQPGDLAACMDIASNAERLACYDAQARGVTAAPAVTMAPAAARQPGAEAAPAPERENFGLSEAQQHAAAAPVREPEQSQEIESVSLTVRSAREYVPGKHRFIFEDGQVWEQTTSAGLLPGNMEGTTAEIERGALGSYQMSVGGKSGIRVRRVQ